MEMAKKRAAGGGPSGNSMSSSNYGSYGSNSSGNIAGYGSSTSGAGNTAASSTAYKSKNDDNEGVYMPEDKPTYNPSSKATTVAPKKGLVLGKKKPAPKETPAAETNQK